jgi:uncharacterized MAPEG superfamily protein
MPIEIAILGWAAVLLIVQIFVAGHYKTKQYGKNWNVGPRDKEMPPLNPIAGRAKRAQDNFLETFPVAIVALLGVVVAERTSTMTALGGGLWLVMRIAYLPVYLAGVSGIRTVIFLVSLLGLLLVLWPLLLP